VKTVKVVKVRKDVCARFCPCGAACDIACANLASSSVLSSNPVTQTSEPIVVVSPQADAPSDDNKAELRTRKLLLLGSGDTTDPLADLARAENAAATAAVAAVTEDATSLKPTTVPYHSQAYVHAPSSARQQAASATNYGRAERMAFRVAQCSLIPIGVRRVA
jgi:hypothetical protein